MAGLLFQFASAYTEDPMTSSARAMSEPMSMARRLRARASSSLFAPFAGVGAGPCAPCPCLGGFAITVEVGEAAAERGIVAAVWSCRGVCPIHTEVSGAETPRPRETRMRSASIASALA